MDSINYYLFECSVLEKKIEHQKSVLSRLNVIIERIDNQIRKIKTNIKIVEKCLKDESYGFLELPTHHYQFSSINKEDPLDFAVSDNYYELYGDIDCKKFLPIANDNLLYWKKFRNTLVERVENELKILENLRNDLELNEMFFTFEVHGISYDNKKIKKLGKKKKPKSIQEQLELIGLYISCSRAHKTTIPTLQQLAEYSNSISKATWGRKLKNASFLIKLNEVIDKRLNYAQMKDETKTFFINMQDHILELANKINTGKVKEVPYNDNISNTTETYE